MAATIQQAFQGLKANLEITGLQEATVAARHEAVRTALHNGQRIVDDFLTGSYRRQTMISPLSEADVDIMVLYPVDYYTFYNNQNGGPAGLLDFTKKTLQKTYTRTPSISRNGQAVTIRFTDFVIDVVTGFHRQGGGYLIANAITNEWISTDPKKHIDLISAANKQHDGQLIPLIKMIKGWNKNHNSYFRSFHLEVLALSIFSGVKISDYPSGVRFFFDKARVAVRGRNFDPAGYGDDIGRYLNTSNRIEEAVGLMTTAYNGAVRAEQHATNYRISAAFDEWQKLFSSYFPAYG